MSKKSKQNENETVHVDAVLTRCRAAVERDERAGAELERIQRESDETRRLMGGYYYIDKLPLDTAQIEKFKAEDARRQAEIEADAALHAVELADGDADAQAVDLQQIRDDVKAALVEAEAFDRRAAEARQRAAQRVEIARLANERITERRSAAGLPPPAFIPYRLREVGSVKTDVQLTLEAIEQVIAEGRKPARSNAERLRVLEYEARETRIARELAAREQEEREKERAANQRWVEEQSEAADRRAREAQEESDAKVAKEQAKRDELERAYCERQARERAQGAAS